MPTPMVECIPNYSEARRPEVVEAILAAIQAVPDVHILDHHSDLDHNRTVVTMVGSPAGVEQAAFDSIAKAAELIDLNQHTGEHPRIGATDVVPFVPISDITMVECVEMARRLGKRVAEELHIPVYLYEEAATRPDRQNLENIRKGQYEGLKEDILVNAERKPDFGPAKLGTAGATVIGARQPLIAFNVYLTTSDVGIAQKISKAIRHSSGGMRFVKAMGVLVEGMAQVSMNMTHYRQTPIARTVELIRREAQRYGVNIHHSELVGLIPQDALVDAAVWYTQMDGFQADQILERRLFEGIRETSAQAGSGKPEFLEELAAATPTPGGGSAAAYVGAISAALTAMVARLTVGKKKYADVEGEMFELVEQAETLRQSLTAAVDEDAQSFMAFMDATRLPKDTPEQQVERRAAMQAATLGAARVPLKTAETIVQAMRLAQQALTKGNLTAMTDAGSAILFGRAAVGAAGLNIRTNVNGLDDKTAGEELEKSLLALEAQADQIVAQAKEILNSRGGIKLS